MAFDMKQIVGEIIVERGFIKQIWTFYAYADH